MGLVRVQSLLQLLTPIWEMDLLNFEAVSRLFRRGWQLAWYVRSLLVMMGFWDTTGGIL